MEKSIQNPFTRVPRCNSLDGSFYVVFVVVVVVVIVIFPFGYKTQLYKPQRMLKLFGRGRGIGVRLH